MMENYKHTTVLLDEAVNGLNIRPDGIYIDGTFGRGGHSRLILSQLGEEGRLLAIDRDPQAIAVAKTIDDPRFSIIHGPFSALGEYVAERDLIGKIDGILLDLGVSSPQLDDAERGFSFMRDGPLDMRMDPTRGQSAAEWLQTAEEADIAWVLKTYGEERFAKRIARAIVERNREQPMTRTKELADKYGVGIHMHVAEAKEEKEYTYARWGEGTVKHLERLGVLDKNLLAVHTVWLTDEELELSLIHI